MKIILNSNGTTEAEGERGLSWFAAYLNFLFDHDIDVMEAEIIMPDGRQAKIFELSEGQYTWEIVK